MAIAPCGVVAFHKYNSCSCLYGKPQKSLLTLCQQSFSVIFGNRNKQQMQKGQYIAFVSRTVTREWATPVVCVWSDNGQTIDGYMSLPMRGLYRFHKAKDCDKFVSDCNNLERNSAIRLV